MYMCIIPFHNPVVSKFSRREKHKVSHWWIEDLTVQVKDALDPQYRWIRFINSATKCTIISIHYLRGNCCVSTFFEGCTIINWQIIGKECSSYLVLAEQVLLSHHNWSSSYLKIKVCNTTTSGLDFFTVQHRA